MPGGPILTAQTLAKKNFLKEKKIVSQLFSKALNLEYK